VELELELVIYFASLILNSHNAGKKKVWLMLGKQNLI